MSGAEALTIAGLMAPGAPLDREFAAKESRRFHIGLVLASLLHGVLFAGFYGSAPRHVGDPSGSKDAISVALISDAELRSLSAAPDILKGAPVPATPRPAPTEAAAPPPQPSPVEPAAQPQRQQPEPAPPPPAASVPEESLTLKPLEAPPREAETNPDTRPSAPIRAEPAPPAKQTRPERAKSARLDLSPPAMFSAPAGAGGAGIERPPGITRSGENDAFARGVVSALQRTMPQLVETRGRVTVRITLDMDGSLVSTEVVRPSNVSGLDRNVVFATRQTSYPFPPRNAKPADLVFLITYIYR